MRLCLLATLLVLGASGCSHSHDSSSSGKNEEVQGPRLVRAPAAFRAQCRSTARAVGYAAPCPSRVPPSFVIYVQQGGIAGCKISIVCPGTRDWRGWVVGSSQSATQHLVVTASPRPLDDDAKLVYGPAWYPAAHVKPIAWVKVGTRRMHAVLVPAGSETAFGDHVVLIWTAGQHTYGVGFHNFTGVRRTLLLDRRLASSIRLVRG